METSNPMAPDVNAPPKARVISLRFKADNEYHQATLQALKDVQVDYPGFHRDLPQKVMFLLSMVLGVRRYTREAFHSVTDVMNTQGDRFTTIADNKQPAEPVPVEKPLVKPGLRLVK